MVNYIMGSNGRVQRSKNQRTVAPNSNTGMVRPGTVQAKGISNAEMTRTMNPFLGNTVTSTTAIMQGAPDSEVRDNLLNRPLGASRLGVRGGNRNRPLLNSRRRYGSILGAGSSGSLY